MKKFLVLFILAVISSVVFLFRLPTSTQALTYNLTVNVTPSSVTTFDQTFLISGMLTDSNGNGVGGENVNIEFRVGNVPIKTIGPSPTAFDPPPGCTGACPPKGSYQFANQTTQSLGLSPNTYAVFATATVAGQSVTSTGAGFSYNTNSQQGTGSTASGPLPGLFGTITCPSAFANLCAGAPETGIGKLLSTVIELIYIFASLIFVFYLLYSGLQFIYSEGSKETVAEARGRIIWAIVGIIFLGLVFVLLRIISSVTNFQFF